MKSKKIIALALTAAIAISAASMTAFAKETKYNTDSDVASPENLTATVTLSTDDSIVKKETVDVYTLKTEYASPTSPTNAQLATNPGKTLTADQYAKLGDTVKEYYEKTGTKDTYYVVFKDLGLKTFDRTITKQQFGWVKTDEATVDSLKTASQTGLNENWTTNKDPKSKDKAYAKGSEKVIYLTDDDLTTAGTAGAWTLYFVDCGRTDTDNDNIKENQKALDAQASKEANAASREETLKKLDAENAATNNVDTGKGVETKKAEKIDGPTAARDVWGNKNYPGWSSGAAHDLSVAGINLDENNLAWVYYVEAPEGLIKGKNARAQLELPDGYTTSGYKVTVYHVKGWCTAEKVKGVNVGTNDVAFWANDFSPYVLVLTPSDAIAGTSTGNPSTGDFSAVPVAMLAAAALSATGFVAYKKRKAE